MAVEIIKGNIFTSTRQTLVNTVNCVGVMGAGIALEFKFRYPDMFERYAKYCDEGAIDIGKLWLFKPNNSDQFVLNFPTKKHWRNPSKIQYLKLGLAKFVETYQQKEIRSIAFPVLGASKGGIPEKESLAVMKEYLSQCSIPTDIYQYDANANDDLYLAFREAHLSMPRDQLSSNMGLRSNLVDNLCRAVKRPDIKSISQLASQKGIGLVSLEKSFRFLMVGSDEGDPVQKSLL